jgi:integrase
VHHSLDFCLTGIRPKWENILLSEVKPAKVEAWLKGIDREPKTKGHLKELLHRLFEKAMLWELLPFERNPMDFVTIKGVSKRSKKPIVLTVEQCLVLISLLPEPYRTMAIVVICTGCRVSEVLALRWSRIDFEKATMMVRVKAVNGRVGRVKTEYSEDELPLDPEFAAVLSSWKKRCPDSRATGSSRVRLPIVAITQVRFSRITFALLERKSDSSRWGGILFAIPTAHGWMQPVRRLECSKNCFVMLMLVRR